MDLLDRDGLRQVAWLIDIKALCRRQLHRENLQRSNCEHRLEHGRRERNGEHLICVREHCRVPCLRDHEHASATRLGGANQLDERKLAEAAGGVTCSRVDADVVRSSTGFPIGGVPPFGHDTALRVFVDPDLLDHDVVWAAAGTWHDVFPIAPADLVRSSGGLVTELRRQ